MSHAYYLHVHLYFRNFVFGNTSKVFNILGFCDSCKFVFRKFILWSQAYIFYWSFQSQLCRTQAMTHNQPKWVFRHTWHIKIGRSHWAFMMAICFWEATFSYKSYDLSDCYRLYISCKNNIGKALIYQINLSDWYQLYISCKNNIETARVGF